MAAIFPALIPSAHAHQPGSSSLVLSIANGELHGEIHLASVDLAALDEMLRLQEPQAETRAAAAHEAGAVKLEWLLLSSPAGALSVEALPARADDSEARPHVVIPFRAPMGDARAIAVDYTKFFGFDPQHRCVVSLTADQEPRVGLLSIDRPRWEAAFAASAAHEHTPASWVQFVREGVWHIWIGFDHILFLVALLLPSVLQRDGPRWAPVPRFRAAFWRVVKVVTAFTAAHSITLGLAATRLVELPPRFVETAIALSVLLAALNNLWPVVRERVWPAAFAFGLIHGFGFANVLGDLALPAGALASTLLSFNLGVELGQLAIVAVFFPLAYSLRGHALYRPVQLYGASAAIAVIAAVWMLERAFALSLAPF